MIYKYLIKKFNLKRIKAYSFIFYEKDDNEKLGLVISVHVDDVFMEGKMETLEKIEEMINLKFNIQESGKLKKFLGVYYGWVCDPKDLYTNMTMEKEVNKLV